MENQPPFNTPVSNKDIFARHSHRISVIIGGIVILLLVIGGIYVAYTKGSFTRVVITPGVPAGYKTITVAPGKFPNGFPNELILYPKAVPTRGEISTLDGSDKTQIITAFPVTDSLTVAFDLYEKTLERNFWQKITESTANGVLYAKYQKNTDTVEVSISQTVKSAQVQLTYVTATPITSVASSTAPAVATTVFAKEPYSGFSQSLVPSQNISSQYWKNGTITGGLFVVKQSLQNEALRYEAQLIADGYKILAKSVTADQATFSVSDKNKTLAITVSIVPVGAGVSVNVRIQR